MKIKTVERKPMEVLENGLTIKENAFVEAYLANGCNGTQAALKAFNTTSENVAASMASEYLRKPKVAQSLRSRQDEYLASLGIDKAAVFKALKK